MSKHLSGAVSLLSAAALVLGFAAQGATAKPFYQGKRLTMLVNFTPGGGADRSARVIARHLPRLLAGEPRIIIKNMPGAGGMIAINYIGEVAKPNGLTVTNFSGGYLFQVLDDPALRVDLRKLEWIAGVGGTTIIYGRKDTPPGLNKPTDLFKIAKPEDFKIAGFRITGLKDLRDRLTLKLLNVKFLPVTGFRGSGKARTAVLQNEVQAFSDSRATWFKNVIPNYVDTGIVIPLWHYDRYDAMGNASPYPDLVDDVPSVSQLFKARFGRAPKDEKEWQMISLLQRLHGVMARNTTMPPGTPKAAVEIMRAAYMKLAKDPAYLADAKKSLAFTPKFTSGPEVLRILNETFTKKEKVRQWLLTFVEEQKNRLQ